MTLRAATSGDLRRALAGLPEPMPAPHQGGSLERGYGRLLALYPAAYRSVHAEETPAVLMTATPEGKRRPGRAEPADLIMSELGLVQAIARGARLVGAGYLP
jgi:hypothetical protein